MGVAPSLLSSFFDYKKKHAIEREEEKGGGEGKRRGYSPPVSVAIVQLVSPIHVTVSMVSYIKLITQN